MLDACVVLYSDSYPAGEFISIIVAAQWLVAAINSVDGLTMVKSLGVEYLVYRK